MIMTDGGISDGKYRVGRFGEQDTSDPCPVTDALEDLAASRILEGRCGMKQKASIHQSDRRRPKDIPVLQMLDCSSIKHPATAIASWWLGFGARVRCGLHLASVP